VSAGTFTVNLAEANPVPPTFIVVNSPENNKIYYSTEVQLDFTLIPHHDTELTSFAYSLDGHAHVATNGSTVITGLSHGSHTLTIYGTATITHDDYENTHLNQTLDVVYFNIFFSTQWVFLSLALSSVIVAVTCTGLLARKRLVRALRGKKTFGFWFGLAWFLFFAAITYTPSLRMINDYLYPQYPPDFGSIGFDWGVIFGIIFMAIGLVVMKTGIKQSQEPQTAISQK
jgi:hypothetical protein